MSRRRYREAGPVHRLRARMIMPLFLLSVFFQTAGLAVTSADQDSAMAAYNRAFWDDSRKVFKLDNTAATVEKFWTSVNEWLTLMDAFERTANAALLSQLKSFYTGFCTFWATKTNPAGTRDWWTITTDSDGGGGVGNYNDDMMWAALSCARAYPLTDSAEHRNQAKRLFDRVWARGYDTVIGGGIYWNTTNDYKSSCINFPAVIAAVYLSDDFGDSTYFVKAVSLYSWCRRNLINLATGAVYDGKRPNGSVGTTTYTYNQGSMIGAAALLFRKTKDSAYYRDAVLAMEYGMKNLCAPGTDVLKDENMDYNQPGFKGIFVLYAARFAKDNSIAKYLAWLQHMASTVYNHRGPGNNCTYKNFAMFGAGTLRNAWEAYGGCNLLQVIPADNACFNLSINRTARSSGNAANQEPAKAVDWSAASGSAWYGNTAGDKWLSVDLGSNCTIVRWEVQHAGAGGESATYNTRNFRLQRSADNVLWTSADSITANTSNQTIKDVTPFTARYVRLYITQAEQSGNTTARIYEFEVFGTAVTAVRSPAVPAPVLSRLQWKICRSGQVTLIRCCIPQPSALHIGIYDLSGRLVRTLVNERAGAGSHTFVCDTRPPAGAAQSSGFFLCRIRYRQTDETRPFFAAGTYGK